VQLRAVRLERGGRRVLKGIGWHIRPGERWVLLGANGSGKTQLLKVTAGIVWPAPGPRSSLRWRLRDERYHTPYEVKDHIAYLGAERQDKYERHGWDLPVGEVVGTGIHRSDIPLAALSRADRKRVRAALQKLGISALARRDFLSLSHGERRVVLLARALAAEPKLLLLDEVFNGLDGLNRERLGRWLRSLKGRLPWVLATHRPQDVPASATHALVLQNGMVAYCGRMRRSRLGSWLPSARHSLEPMWRRTKAPASAAPILVRLTDASVYLGERRVLGAISLTVRAGEFWVIHGKNGSGKTTLLRTLYGDHGVAVGGTIEHAGVEPGEPLDKFRRRAGLVAPHLQAEYPRTLTVLETVRSGRHASMGMPGPPSAADRSAARRALTRVGLTKLAHRTLGELSYGQTRSVLLARALACNPTILLLDEPFAGLDAATHRKLRNLVLSLAERGVTIVVAAHGLGEWRAVASHDLELVGGRARVLRRAAPPSSDSRRPQSRRAPSRRRAPGAR
jgi:molybdate transport system ATP-binding protein